MQLLAASHSSPQRFAHLQLSCVELGLRSPVFVVGVGAVFQRVESKVGVHLSEYERDASVESLAQTALCSGLFSLVSSRRVSGCECKECGCADYQDLRYGFTHAAQSIHYAGAKRNPRRFGARVSDTDDRGRRT